MNDLASLSRHELEELERHLIPFLNKVRKVLGKPPVITPKTQDQTNLAEDWRKRHKMDLAPGWAPWRFVIRNAKAEPRPIPDEGLRHLTKQHLQFLARDYGFQTKTLHPTKAEYVEALEWLRGVLE